MSVGGIGRWGTSIRLGDAAGLALALCLVVGSGCSAPARHLAAPGSPPRGPARETGPERRPFDASLHGRGIVNAIAYGPYRDGQAPGGARPSREQIREDLRLLARHWSLIRLYGAIPPAEDVLSVIREDGLPMRVMLGVWIAPEERRDSTGAVTDSFPAARESNRAEVEAAVRLANEYGDIVRAISVGNETQVQWSDHRVPAEDLIRILRSVRSRTRVPVTTADDYNFWNKPESRAVADAVDFIVLHAHPMWNGRQVEEALEWTAGICDTVRTLHPGVPMVLGETGWATRRHTEGEQARLIQGRAGEAEQKAFYEAVTGWARRTRTVTFFFEAFDENWKGGSHPDEVEKHWGLFRADRTPKAAIAGTR